jgi:hypothetical protein
VGVGVLVPDQQRPRGDESGNAEEQRGDGQVWERRDVECGCERT